MTTYIVKCRHSDGTTYETELRGEFGAEAAKYVVGILLTRATSPSPNPDNLEEVTVDWCSVEVRETEKEN